MTRDSYVPRAVSIHGDKYGYDRVPSEFRATDKIEIFCKKCEEYFTCTARNHTNSKSGCPRCGRKLANSNWKPIYRGEHHKQTQPKGQVNRD